MLFRQSSYRMTLILFTVFAGKTCSAMSLLPQDFYANFSGDPFTGDAPHDMFMRQVLHCNGALCGTVHNRTAQRAAVVIDLKLHHRQMHYRQSPFLNIFTKRRTTKGVKNMLPGHEKHKIFTTKSHLGEVKLMGLSL